MGRGRGRRLLLLPRALEALCTLWAASFGSPAACALRAASSPLRGGPRLGLNSRGEITFVQFPEETTLPQRHRKLYEVQVSFDLEDMSAETGVTMVFDKTAHKLMLVPGLSPNEGVAWGRYVDHISTTGWSELYLEFSSAPDMSNDVGMYAAGFIEGLLTCVRLSEYHANTFKLVMMRERSAHALASIRKLFKNELGFMMQKARVFPTIIGDEPKEVYWKHARYVFFQMWGVADGYNYAAAHFGVKKLALEDLLLLNSAGELPDLFEAYDAQAVADRAGRASLLQRGRRALRSRDARTLAFNNATTTRGSEGDPLDDAHWKRRLRETGHCSALVRASDDGSDVFMGHTTWDDYSRMTRIFKYYKFPLKGADTMATHIGFSSYPGLVSSTDDFYIMDSGLGAMQTTIEVLDSGMWNRIADFPDTPHIPTFVHIMATNRLAKSGPHWTRLYSSMNAGTYASQWMVVDYNLLRPGKPIPDNVLWLVEAVPGLTHQEDLSDHLRRNGYWPSFNRPFFDDVRLRTGFQSATRSHGALYSWADNPRAHIFAKEAPNANAIGDMRLLMTHNAYPHTGVLPSDPGHEISARNDLSIAAPIPNGGIDTKVTSRCLIARMMVQAVSGPTHSALAPFKWTVAGGGDLFAGYPHEGLPDVWNFGFVQITPEGTSAKLHDLVDC